MVRPAEGCVPGRGALRPAEGSVPGRGVCTLLRVALNQVHPPLQAAVTLRATLLGDGRASPRTTTLPC